MKNRNFLLVITFWCELIISARVLMFTVPVLINKYVREGLSQGRLSDLTIWVLTLLAFFYFLTGLSGLLKMRWWKLFHYLGFVFALGLSACLLVKVWEHQGSIAPLYFMPILFVTALTIAVSVIKETKSN